MPEVRCLLRSLRWGSLGLPIRCCYVSLTAPYIFNVYVQNHRLNPDAEPTLTTWSKGQVSVDHIGIWDTGGVDFDSVFEGLSAIGYAGYVTVHQAFGGIMSVTEAVTRSHEFLTTYSGGG